jgi:hypothetical protein
MFNRAPSLGRLTLALLCLVGLIGWFFLVRCTHDRSPRSTSANASDETQAAHLTMLNSSDCEWRIVITSMAGGDRRSWKMPVAKSLDVELAGGDYQVEQTMVTTGVGSDETRRFSMRLVTGQSYRWRLMTLLSGEAVDPLAPAAAKDGHE